MKTQFPEAYITFQVRKRANIVVNKQKNKYSKDGKKCIK